MNNTCSGNHLTLMNVKNFSKANQEASEYLLNICKIKRVNKENHEQAEITKGN